MYLISVVKNKESLVFKEVSFSHWKIHLHRITSVFNAKSNVRIFVLSSAVSPGPEMLWAFKYLLDGSPVPEAHVHKYMYIEHVSTETKTHLCMFKFIEKILRLPY